MTAQTNPDQNSPHRIRVLIVDDHAAVRHALTVFLQAFDDLELVGEAVDGEEAIRMCIETKPDVILMDLTMPVMDGIAATRAIRQVCPDSQIIALSSFGDQALVREVLQAGAISYLLKDTPVNVLADAIRAAHASQSSLLSVSSPASG
jgi:DNA-binding NarL/FixJ family response regulator